MLNTSTWTHLAHHELESVVIIIITIIIITIIIIITVIVIIVNIYYYDSNMMDKNLYNSPSVATVVAGIASSADIAEGDDIIGVGHKATQEDKGQHSPRACKH
jgi:hypothetical protein